MLLAWDIRLVLCTWEHTGQAVRKKTFELDLENHGLGVTSWAGSGRTFSLIGSKTKIEIFNSNVHSVLLYGCETRRMTKANEKKLDVFLHESLCRTLNIYWPMRITNEEIRIRAGIEPISKQVARRRWTRLRMTRIDHHFHLRIALTWVPEGRIVFESRDLWQKKLQLFFHARST